MKEKNYDTMVAMASLPNLLMDVESQTALMAAAYFRDSHAVQHLLQRSMDLQATGADSLILLVCN